MGAAPAVYLAAHRKRMEASMIDYHTTVSDYHTTATNKTLDDAAEAKVRSRLDFVRRHLQTLGPAYVPASDILALLDAALGVRSVG